MSNALLCSSLSCGVSLCAVLGGLLVFRKSVCKNHPKFPVLCSSTAKKAQNTAGGQEIGTAAAGTSGKANVTAFGWSGDDNGQGFSGIDLHKFGVSGMKFQGKPLLPIAVYMGHGAAFLWKVLEVRAKGLPTFYGVVVDLCDSSQDVCKRNTNYNGLNFLIDIHTTAFKAMGIPEAQAKNYLSTGEYTVIGHVKPTDIPASLYIPGVAAGTDSLVCSCTGGCTVKEAVWGEYGKC